MGCGSSQPTEPDHAAGGKAATPRQPRTTAVAASVGVADLVLHTLHPVAAAADTAVVLATPSGPGAARLTLEEAQPRPAAAEQFLLAALPDAHALPGNAFGLAAAAGASWVTAEKGALATVPRVGDDCPAGAAWLALFLGLSEGGGRVLQLRHLESGLALALGCDALALAPAVVPGDGAAPEALRRQGFCFHAARGGPKHSSVVAPALRSGAHTVVGATGRALREGPLGLRFDDDQAAACVELDVDASGAVTLGFPGGALGVDDDGALCVTEAGAAGTSWFATPSCDDGGAARWLWYFAPAEYPGHGLTCGPDGAALLEPYGGRDAQHFGVMPPPLQLTSSAFHLAAGDDVVSATPDGALQSAASGPLRLRAVTALAHDYVWLLSAEDMGLGVFCPAAPGAAAVLVPAPEATLWHVAAAGRGALRFSVAHTPALSLGLDGGRVVAGGTAGDDEFRAVS